VSCIKRWLSGRSRRLLSLAQTPEFKERFTWFGSNHGPRAKRFSGGPTVHCDIAREQPVARIRHIDRTFWLETLGNVYHPIAIDGVPLVANQLAALGPGMSVAFGNEVAKIDRPQQMHLD